MKPRLRGVFHQYAFFVSLVAGTLLVLTAPTPRAEFAVAVYAVPLCGLFGVSALYHRLPWPPPAERWLRRLDHAMIFLLIAGTYTPFALFALSGPRAIMVLAVVWAAALAGVVLTLAWIDAPHWVTASVCVALGWAVVAALPELAGHAGPIAVALLLGGGALYTAGGLVYALGRPNPAPAVFGYHEVFHALVVAAATAHFAAIASSVLPRG